MTELSEAAQAICAQHYNFKSRSSCNACPTGITDMNRPIYFRRTMYPVDQCKCLTCRPIKPVKEKDQ